jgi:Flp pilus assembly protein TadD
MMRPLLAVLLLAGLFVAGCTTDQPLVSNPRAARLEGVELYNRADYENAVGAFRNAVRQDPRDYRSHYALGVTYERLNNVQQAVQSYKAALRVMRETPVGRDDVDFRQVVMNSLASTIRRNDHHQLEQQLLSTQASDLSIDSRLRAESYFLLAKIERYRRDADSALQAYTMASELDRDDFWLQKEAGLYMLQMGQNNRAVKPIQRANQLNSRDPEILSAMSQLKLSTGPTLASGQGGAAPLFAPRPLPPVDLKVGDTVAGLPDQLPRY